jgi:hypothetical protein
LIKTDTLGVANVSGRPLADPFFDGIYSSATPPISVVYCGMARRAFDVAGASFKTRTSTVLNGKTYVHRGYIQTLFSQAANRQTRWM